MCMLVSGGQEDRMCVKTNLSPERLTLTWYTKCNHTFYWNATILVGKVSVPSSSDVLPYILDTLFLTQTSPLPLNSSWSSDQTVNLWMSRELTGPYPVLQLDSILKFRQSSQSSPLENVSNNKSSCHWFISLYKAQLVRDSMLQTMPSLMVGCWDQAGHMPYDHSFLIGLAMWPPFFSGCLCMSYAYTHRKYYWELWGQHSNRNLAKEAGTV